jgi:hypothetical protein
MKECTVWDEKRGEIRILGHRHVAIDVEALCEHLDQLVGAMVAEVMMNQHEFHLGKENATRLRMANPQAAITEIVDMVAEADRLSGVGVTKVTMPQDALGPIEVEVSNPCVRKTTGTAKSILFSYWSGILSSLLSRKIVVGNVVYDADRNILKCTLVAKTQG